MIDSNAYVICGFFGVASWKIIWLKIETEPELKLTWLPMDKIWEPKGYSLIEPRYGHTSVKYDKSIYIFGGQIESTDHSKQCTN